MNETEIHCPNCKALLPQDLQRDLFSGKTVTCENCGIVLVPRMQGQVNTSINGGKQAPKIENPPSAIKIPQKAAYKSGIQVPTISRHQQCNELRKQNRESRASERRESRQQRRESREQRKAVKKTIIPKPEYSDSSQIKGTREADLQNRLNRLRRHIHAFNNFSLNLLKLFLGLFYVISFASVVYNFVLYQFNIVYLITALLKLLPQYVIGVFIYWYETRHLFPWISHDQYEFYGIDIVIAGFIGLSVSGIGLLLVIKGFMVMNYMITQDRLLPKPRRDVLISWINGFDEISWMIPVIGAMSAFSSMTNTMVNSVVLNVPDSSFITFLVLGILGIISANNDLQKVSIQIRAWKFNKLGGKALWNAILGIVCFGSGIPMLVKAILLYQIDEYDRQHPVETPAKVESPGQEITPEVSPRSVQREPVLHVPRPVQPIVVTPEIPTTRSTGIKQPRAPAPTSTPAKPRFKPAPTVPSILRKDPASIEAFLQRSFSVLTPRVRKRLMKLKKFGMSDDEIEGVAEELVFHPEFEQLDIIDDYMALNKDDIDPMHVLAVRNMTYDENTKKWILDQLKTIPEKDIPAFLDQMKNSQPN